MPKETVPILMYHAVAENPAAATFRLSVSPEALEGQLTFLVERGFTGLTFSAVAEAFATGAPLPKRPVVFTFDDGYADFAREAWPLLDRYGFPATVFVTTGWVTDAGPRSEGMALDEMLTWSQIRDLAAAGVEIGAHSHSHAQLDQLPEAELSRELSDSRTQLEECTGVAIRTLAYPFGYSNKRVRLAVRSAGYRYAASVRNVLATPYDDPFRIPRLTVRRNTDLATFAEVMDGPTDQPFRRDRLLTAGWASVRAARRATNWVRRNAGQRRGARAGR